MDPEPDLEEPNLFFYQRRKLLTAAIALTVLCTQIATIMALPIDKERAMWNETETKEFLQYLLDHQAEGGDGGNFKAATLNAAARHIASHRTSGPVKVGKHARTKWDGVSHSLSAF
jgi:hypothetical protein